MATAAAASVANPGSFTQSGSYWRFNMVEPRSNISSSGYFGSAAYIGTEATLEAWSDAAQIDWHFLAFNSAINVWVDGERIQAAQFTTNSSGNGWVLTLGYAAAGLRNYKINGINLAFAQAKVPQGYSVWAPIETRQPLAYVLGDSYTFGTGSTSFAIDYAHVMANAVGWDILPDGIGGTGYTSAGANLPATRISSDLALRDQIPDYLILALGYNDQGQNMTTLTTNFNAAVAAARAAWPNVKILALGPWTPIGPSADLTIVQNAISAACLTAAIQFIDISALVTASNAALYTGVDNTHPNTAGHAYLGGRIAQLLLQYFKAA